MTCHMSSPRRLCSATLPGCVAKSASSAAMLESRFSISFLTAGVPCEPVRQRIASSRGPYSANLAIDMSRGGGLQGGFERTESIRGLLCDICGFLCNVKENVDSLVHSILVVSLRS